MILQTAFCSGGKLPCCGKSCPYFSQSKGGKAMVINLTKKKWMTMMRAGSKKLKVYRMIHNPSNKTESPLKILKIAKNTNNNQFHIKSNRSTTISLSLTWSFTLMPNEVKP
jgi:hypothetical protein